ncbi:hypothetical protein ACERK3_17105 [Phycisphaerales bacterium AB-hyl4]|uniref:Uncharacterized protein n=1 Tax=Natronomicrosphaera hydrolytica TaxID=3242702 RepID=A0ABV4U8R1_9BACT
MFDMPAGTSATSRTTVGAQSLRGHITFSIVTEWPPPEPHDKQAPLLSEEELWGELDAKIQSGEVTVSVLEAPPRWYWLAFDYDVVELPVASGSTTLQWIAIPYWFLVLLFGLWPAIRLTSHAGIIRPLRQSKTEASEQVSR